MRRLVRLGCGRQVGVGEWTLTVRSPAYGDHEGQESIWGHPASRHALFRDSPLIQNHVLQMTCWKVEQRDENNGHKNLQAQFSFLSPSTHILRATLHVLHLRQQRGKCHPAHKPRARPQTRSLDSLSSALSKVTNIVHPHHWTPKSPSIHSASPGSRRPLPHKKES